MKGNWEEVGEVWVDSGSIMVGDPCYTHGQDASHAVEDWDDFLARTWPKVFGKKGEIDHTAKMDDVTYALSEKGIGVVVSSGFGDGVYPVFVKYSNEGQWGKRVAEVKVVFIDDDGHHPYEPEWNSEDEDND